MMTSLDPDAATLERLQEKYAGEYRIVRTPCMWKATRLIHDDREPTVTADTVEELEEAMENPRRRIGWWEPLT